MHGFFFLAASKVEVLVEVLRGIVLRQRSSQAATKLVGPLTNRFFQKVAGPIAHIDRITVPMCSSLGWVAVAAAITALVLLVNDHFDVVVLRLGTSRYMGTAQWETIFGVNTCSGTLSSSWFGMSTPLLARLDANSVVACHFAIIFCWGDKTSCPAQCWMLVNYQRLRNDFNINKSFYQCQRGRLILRGSIWRIPTTDEDIGSTTVLYGRRNSWWRVVYRWQLPMLARTCCFET